VNMIAVSWRTIVRPYELLGSIGRHATPYG